MNPSIFNLKSIVWRAFSLFHAFILAFIWVMPFSDAALARHFGSEEGMMRLSWAPPLGE